LDQAGDIQKQIQLIEFTVDRQKITLLTFCVQKQRTNFIFFLLKRYFALLLQQNNDKDFCKKRVSWYVNKLDGKFNALHLAAFMDEVVLIELFIGLGADYNLKTEKGCGVMHFAAQGDAATSLTYFKKRNLCINEKD
jgi:hypothetical protein